MKLGVSSKEQYKCKINSLFTSREPSRTLKEGFKNPIKTVSFITACVKKGSMGHTSHLNNI